MSAEAVIRWRDGEHPTTCPTRVSSVADNRRELRFEGRWYFIFETKAGAYVNLLGERQPVAFKMG